MIDLIVDDNPTTQHWRHLQRLPLNSRLDLVCSNLVCRTVRLLDRVSKLLSTVALRSSDVAVDSRRRYRNRQVATTLLSSAPGVSILRPLKGLDTNLFENLESSFKQEYPNFEILLSVADEHDKALPVVYELLARYPNVNARVIIGTLSYAVAQKVTGEHAI